MFTRANLIAKAVEKLENVEVEKLIDAVWDGLVGVIIPAKGKQRSQCPTVAAQSRISRSGSSKDNEPSQEIRIQCDCYRGWR